MYKVLHWDMNGRCVVLINVLLTVIKPDRPIRYPDTDTHRDALGVVKDV